MTCKFVMTWIVVMSLAAVASAVEPAELVDASLDRQSIGFVSLGGGRLMYFDANRQLQQGDPAQFVRLIFTGHGATGPADANPLLLNDGQIFMGHYVGVDAQGQLLWKTQQFGQLAIKLDNLTRAVIARPAPPADDHTAASADPAGGAAAANVQPQANVNVIRGVIVNRPVAPNGPPGGGIQVQQRVMLNIGPVNGPAPAPAPPPAPEEPAATPTPAPALPDANTDLPGVGDHAIMQNGDIVTGFVTKLTADGLVMKVDQQNLPLDWKQVGEVRLQNPVQDRPGVWAELTDGSRVRIDAPVLDSSGLTGRVAAASVHIPFEQVAALDFATRHRLAPLSKMTSNIVSGGVVFGVPMPPTVRSGMIHLHAPVAVQYDLPRGAQRVAITAALDSQGLDWADLTLNLADGKGPLGKLHLDASNPEGTVNVQLRDRSLTLSVEDGANGPVFDRLTLRHADVLVDVK